MCPQYAAIVMAFRHSVNPSGEKQVLDEVCEVHAASKRWGASTAYSSSATK
jgi:hypothetical protein